MHKHGHHLAGLATLFWTIFVILILIFHLFLFKLIYRELCAPNIGGGNGANSQNNNYYNNNQNDKSYYYDSYRRQRYARTV
jgi:hypothetical protein